MHNPRNHTLLHPSATISSLILYGNSGPVNSVLRCSNVFSVEKVGFLSPVPGIPHRHSLLVEARPKRMHFAVLSQVSGGLPTKSRRRGTQVLVHRLERSKESDEGPSQMLRRRTSLSKITVPKLIGNGNHRRAHGSIFMRALCPSSSALVVNPDREAHGYSSA